MDALIDDFEYVCEQDENDQDMEGGEVIVEPQFEYNDGIEENEEQVIDFEPGNELISAANKITEDLFRNANQSTGDLIKDNLEQLRLAFRRQIDEVKDSPTMQRINQIKEHIGETIHNRLQAQEEPLLLLNLDSLQIGTGSNSISLLESPKDVKIRQLERELQEKNKTIERLQKQINIDEESPTPTVLSEDQSARPCTECDFGENQSKEDIEIHIGQTPQIETTTSFFSYLFLAAALVAAGVLSIPKVSKALFPRFMKYLNFL